MSVSYCFHLPAFLLYSISFTIANSVWNFCEGVFMQKVSVITRLSLAEWVVASSVTVQQHCLQCDK
jgi:hypothetical protein